MHYVFQVFHINSLFFSLTPGHLVLCPSFFPPILDIGDTFKKSHEVTLSVCHVNLEESFFLGWFRQCDIIPYSKDVDIGIRIKDYREEMVTALENNGLHLIQLFGKVKMICDCFFVLKYTSFLITTQLGEQNLSSIWLV